MATDLTAPRTAARPDVASIQRRTLRLLFTTQIIGGIGVTIGIAVGALLAARIAGTAVAGVAQSAGVVGAALLAVPVTRIMARHGRRPGLVLAYAVGAVGGLLVVLAAATRWVPLLFLGMLLFGGGTAANLQARYTAVDLAEPARRGPAALPDRLGHHHRCGGRAELRRAGRPGHHRLGAASAGRPVRVQRGGVRAGCRRAPRVAPARPAAHRAAARGGRRAGRRSAAGADATATAVAAEAPAAGAVRRRPPRRSRCARRAAPGCGRPGRWYADSPPPGSASPPWRSGHLVMVGGDGDDPGAHRRVARRRRRAAAGRHRAEPAHRRHVRVLPGGRLAHRPARSAGGDPRRGRAAAGRLRGRRHRRAPHASALGRSGPARAGLVGDDGGRLDAAVRVGAGRGAAERRRGCPT